MKTLIKILKWVTYLWVVELIKLLCKLICKRKNKKQPKNGGSNRWYGN